MARKPAQTTTKPAAEEKVAVKPEADIKAPVEEAVPEKEAGKPDAATASENTEGAETAQQAADAPNQAPADDVQGQTGGEDGSDLPATNNPQQLDDPAAAHQGEAPRSMAELLASGSATSLAASEVDWIVTCHREDGRRRAGRRWPRGETPVRGGELNAHDLALLQGDPQFTVRKAGQD
ncbi:hypothetical protein LO749_06505 [Paracoccus denitrificans]|uniref:hypothetical protein n=1 Tax=Paracoccus denitrificans TaxID=266 RepID=UPI001E2C77BD|nr:hypothetical protein [Paracoccus denitrificans]UFS63838.1 hypothetical protein LO749_06505 [Paracoccus denitrificans]